MSDIAVRQLVPAVQPDAQAMITDEFADARGSTRELRATLDRVARQRDRVGPDNWGGLEIVCTQASRVATAMARLKFVVAALAPAYTAKPAAPRWASMVVKLMMLPPPRMRNNGTARFTDWMM